MKKRFGSLALAVIMLVGTLSGCGSSTASSAVPAASGSAGSSSAASSAPSALEPATLVVSYPMFAPEPADLAKVEAEINKLTQAELNVTIKLKPHAVSAYGEQIKLQMIAQEKVDVLITGNIVVFDSYTNQVNNGQLLPLDDLLPQYGQEMVDVMGPVYAKASAVNGKVYGIPQNRDLAVARSFVMNADLADKHGIDPAKITNTTELEAAFEIIKKNEPSMYAFFPGDTPSPTATGLYHFDVMDNSFGVLENNGANDTKVVNKFQSQDYIDSVKLAKKWTDAGYMFPDSATTDQTPYELLGTERVFGFLSSYKPGIAGQVSRRSGGKRMYEAILSAPYTYSGKVTNFMWSVAAHTDAPEQAVRFMNLMYTSPEYMNLIAWGIEGEHYVKKSGNTIAYPEGKDAGNIGYNTGTSWLFGNEMLCYVMEGDPDDLRSQMDEFNQSAVPSKALGFTFNSEKVANEVAACQVINNEVFRQLECGLVTDVEKACADFSKRLMDAGMQKIIDEKQAQLDAFVASK